ncbi:MAG: ABC transporter ATP-binding protein/permease [Oscillospiraceae bacterium]|nr:ABC transporter ATP-binding protein/permease [Oscillospiraceae bacterium]
MKRWYKYIKPYLPLFIITPICMLIEVFGEVIIPRLMAIIINQQNAGTLTLSTCILVMLGIVVCAAVMMAGGAGGSYFGAKASVNFACDLRQDVFEKVQTFSFANIDRFSTSSLVTRLTNDITQMQNFVNQLLRMAFRAPGMMIMALIMAISISPSLSAVFAVAIPVLLCGVGLIIFKGFSRFQTVQKKLDGLNATVRENVTNVRVVKSFVREDKEIDKFSKANGDYKSASLSAVKIMIFIGPVMTLIMNVTTVCIIYFGGQIVLDNGMEVGNLTAFITYAAQILSSLMMVSMLLMTSSRALVSARRISQVLDEEPDINDDNAAHKELTVQNGEIEFKNVTFRYYKNSEDSVLTDINLKIPAHSTVGIVGSTGCGKTTLVSMIARLYEVDEGEVLVDGVNVKDYSLYNLREGIGMVLQNNTLFSGTIEENLRWGDENATEEEIKAAAQSAQADKFVSSFKDGYQTAIDQGGTNVSGGQKQRLCIARALLKSPKVLILDDSTSAVDTATEAQIRKAFRNELADSTKIIIAQRISSVKDADMIIVMNEGKISGVGTHDELLASNEAYQEIYYSQNDSEKKAV